MDVTGKRIVYTNDGYGVGELYIDGKRQKNLVTLEIAAQTNTDVVNYPKIVTQIWGEIKGETKMPKGSTLEENMLKVINTNREERFNSTIVVRLSTEFIHKYENAPDDVAFLRYWHRHMLDVEVEMEVTHLDRELEFIMVKRALHELFEKQIIKTKYVKKSCETICREIIDSLINKYGERSMTVTASEDGENCGRVYYRREN